jgi:hypothetical protein
MTPSKPPAIASWLLEHSGTDAAIVGDILEEFAKGRTATWFWKQAIVASVRIASRQRISVARIGACVLVICGGLFSFMSPLLGFRFRASDFLLGAFVVLVGTLPYFSSNDLKTILWREIDLDWLGGLTRPHQGPSTKD